MTIKESSRTIIKSVPEAQRLIGLMISEKSGNIIPCNNCHYATKNGCNKEVFKPSGNKSKEIGPFFEPSEKAVVCPIQKGVIYASGSNGYA